MLHAYRSIIFWQNVNFYSGLIFLVSFFGDFSFLSLEVLFWRPRTSKLPNLFWLLFCRELHLIILLDFRIGLPLPLPWLFIPLDVGPPVSGLNTTSLSCWHRSLIFSLRIWLSAIGSVVAFPLLTHWDKSSVTVYVFHFLLAFICVLRGYLSSFILLSRWGFWGCSCSVPVLIVLEVFFEVVVISGWGFILGLPFLACIARKHRLPSGLICWIIWHF
jgi:hypothetical protein